jgi:sarcosine oxidase gamma subunit
LFSEYLGYRRLTEQVRKAADGHHTVALDFSDGLTVFRLTGNGIPWLLGKLSGLDFGGGLPAAAYCARTRLQHVSATLHYHQPGGLATESVFDLIVDRNVARYLWELLVASAPHAEELEQQFGNH